MCLHLLYSDDQTFTWNFFIVKKKTPAQEKSVIFKYVVFYLCIYLFIFIVRVIKVFNHLRVMQFKKNLHNLTDKNCNRKTVEHEINLFVNAQHLNNTFIIYYVVDCFFELPQSQCSGTAHPGVFKQKCNFTVSVSSFKVFMTLIDHKHNLSGHRFHLTLKKKMLSHSYAAITKEKNP